MLGSEFLPAAAQAIEENFHTNSKQISPDIIPSEDTINDASERVKGIRKLSCATIYDAGAAEQVGVFRCLGRPTHSSTTSSAAFLPGSKPTC